MPIKPNSCCKHPGCNVQTPGTYCEEHSKQYKPKDINRANSYRRGYDKRWQKARKGFLASNPLCVECMKHDKYESATVVDHIKPHRGDKQLFWDESNWQPLCKRCHDKKTRRGE